MSVTNSALQVESYAALGGAGLEALSYQQATACAPNPLVCGGGGGCLGSVEQLAYSYLQLFGAVRDEDYPYTGASHSSLNLYDCTTSVCSWHWAGGPTYLSVFSPHPARRLHLRLQRSGAQQLPG